METGLESVTHGQCDARPTVTFPVTEQNITAVWPVPNYTAWCAIMIRQECVIIIISHSTLKSISSILTEYAACVVTVIIVGRDDLRSTVSLCVCVCVCVCVASDRDECRENRTTCPQNAVCHNTNSSFICVCPDNFYYHQQTLSCRGSRTLFYTFWHKSRMQCNMIL